MRGKFGGNERYVKWTLQAGNVQDSSACQTAGVALPTRQELELPFDEALVVEYYQR